MLEPKPVIKMIDYYYLLELFDEFSLPDGRDLLLIASKYEVHQSILFVCSKMQVMYYN